VIFNFLSNSAIKTIPASEVILPPSKLAIMFLPFNRWGSWAKIGFKSILGRAFRHSILFLCEKCGIKDGDEVAQSFSTVIGDGIENIVKGLIGAENYTALSETWAKANRIYQSAVNVYQLMTDSLFGITEGLEQIGKYTGKIGNALKKSGTVLEDSYNWMTETFNFSSGKNRKIDQVVEGLRRANEVASDLESITSEFRSVTENVAEISTELNTIKTEISGKENEKDVKETEGKESSQSPLINKSDLTKPS